MKISVEIPDKLHSELKKVAARQCTTINELIVRLIRTIVEKENRPNARRVKLPLIESDRPGSVELDNEKIYEIIDFP